MYGAMELGLSGQRNLLVCGASREGPASLVLCERAVDAHDAEVDAGDTGRIWDERRAFDVVDYDRTAQLVESESGHNDEHCVKTKREDVGDEVGLALTGGADRDDDLMRMDDLD